MDVIGDSQAVPSQSVVHFQMRCGTVLTAPLVAVLRNSVLKMVWQHAASAGAEPLHVDDESRSFRSLLRHLEGATVDLSQSDYVDNIAVLRCAHKYQNYAFASDILRYLTEEISVDTILHLYSVLVLLPELPVVTDPRAPSAPPPPPSSECPSLDLSSRTSPVELCHSDPEQARFSQELQRSHQICLQVFDEGTTQALCSDALLSLSGDMMCSLLQRDSLVARECHVAGATLRWLRHYSMLFCVERQWRRSLVLGCVRLLQLSPAEIRRLQLRQMDVLNAEELAAVMHVLRHGTGPLPPELHVYRTRWQTPRARALIGCRLWPRLLIGRLLARTRAPSLAPLQSPLVVEQRRQQQEKSHRRADKLKLALATVASLIFD